MALQTGDVKQVDPLPAPVSAPDDTSPESTTAYSPDQSRPVDTAGLGVIAQIAKTGGASYDSPLPDDWAAPTTVLGEDLSQFLPTAQQFEKARQADIEYTKDKGIAESYFANERDERDREFYRSMRSRLDQEAVNLNELKPWNPVTMAPPKHDLWEQFGSPGVLIAMMASAFTAYPMVSALNSSAAAMNAINQGDLDGYNRAFDEWKANTDLAIKRHNLEHTEFEEIGQLWDRDMVSGKARMEAYLAQIGDKRKLALLQAGMDDEAWKSIDATHTAFNNIVKFVPTMLETKALVDTVNKDPRWTNGTDRMGAYTDAIKKINEAKAAGRYGQTLTAQQRNDIDRQRSDWLAANPQRSGESDEDYAKRREDAYDDITRRVMTSYKPFEERRLNLAEWKAQADEQHKQVADQVKQGQLSIAQAKQQEDEQHKKNQDAIAQGRLDKSITDAEEKKRHDEAMERLKELEIKTKGTQLTANKAAELRIASDRYRTGIETIDKLTALVNKHVGAVGVAGYATRAAESMSNVIAGSKETDRREIESLLNELQMLTPRLVTESTSRPMAAEHEHVSKVVRGLQPGDTKPNVLTRLKELRDQLVRIKGNMDGIIEGKPFEPEPEKPETPKTDSKPEWQRGVPVNP